MTTMFLKNAARTILFATVFSGLLLAFGGTSSAQSPYYWDPTLSSGSAGGGTGTWSGSGANWWNGESDTTFGGGSDDAYFDGTGGSVSISGVQTANNLYFNVSGYTLGGSALTLNGGTMTVAPGAVATTATLLNFPNNYSAAGWRHAGVERATRGSRIGDEHLLSGQLNHDEH